MKVLALASYDSFLHIARLIAPYFEEKGASVEISLVKARARSQFSREQLARFSLDKAVSLIDLSVGDHRQLLSKYDIVLSCLEGGSTRKLFQALAGLGANRPLTISTYPGLVLRFPFDGYSMRCNSDLFWLNSLFDQERYKIMCDAYGLNGSNARVCGNLSVLEAPDKGKKAKDGPVVFFEQAIIPSSLPERKYLAYSLIKLANDNPGKQFILKLRMRKGETTLHRVKHDLETLLHSYANPWPKNLVISHNKSAGELLSHAGFCLTICSTVAIEALYRGVPTTLISDFGAHDDYGMSYFFGSGLLRRFEEISLEHPPFVNAEWLSHYTADPRKNIKDLIREAIQMARHPIPPIESRAAMPEMAPELLRFLEAELGEAAVLSRRYKKATPIIKTGFKRIHTWALSKF